MHRGKFVGMDGISAALRHTATVSRSVGSSSFSRCDNAATAEFSGPCCGRDRRPPHVRRRAHLRIVSRRLYMLSLRRYRPDMSLAPPRFFFRGRTRIDSAVTAVERDVVLIAVDHGRVVDVMNFVHVDIHDGAVVEEMSAVPASPFKTGTEIAKAVVDAAIETNVRSPIAVPPPEVATFPTPPSRSPKETDFRRQNPCPWNPVIVVDVIVVSPVPGIQR